MGKGLRRSLCMAAALTALVAGGAQAATPQKAASQPAGVGKPWAEAVQGLSRLDGLVPVFVDKAQGKIFLSLPAPDASGAAGRWLYMTALETGLGSAPVGLDRDAPSEAQILVFRRVGKKVFA
jgi:hypothetical protein